MIDKDLLKIIARVTAKSITEVSEVYYGQQRDSSKSKKAEEGANDTESGSFPFGTSISDIAKFANGAKTFTKHIDSFTREHFQKKDS